ncbi:prepilin-type N-terminal cleavage/methylation domain-containing protein [bacterium]|nr:prepilin-type N-terminal cleavage/methylation domain-containing protein [bacterium]
MQYGNDGNRPLAHCAGSSGRRGFTLVEVLVVVLIAGIVLVVLAQVLGASFEILRTGEQRAQLNSNARVVLEYLADDIGSATSIPLCDDRDLNGVPDEAPLAEGGYDVDAVWRVARRINNANVIASSYFLSEAWSDRIMTVHDNSVYIDGSVVQAEGFTNPKVIGNGQTRVRQVPVADNISRIHFDYLHQVPVYLSRVNGNTLEIAYQDVETGAVEWEAPSADRTGTMINKVPVISHWEQRVVDVAYDEANAGGFFADGSTGATYGVTFWSLRDQYPEGHSDLKRTGDHVAVPTGMGLGTIGGGGVETGWNCTVFYNTSTGGAGTPADNAPIDRFAFVSTGLSGGNAVEGGIAQLRPDMEALHGGGYYNYSIDPTGIGDFGDADGIPDGDGIPDDPVPGWWLPYVRAVRITVVATPERVMQQRTERSGLQGSTGTPLYYKLDSPVPYADPSRTQPLYNLKKDYIGAGQDLILTKTVPVNFSYRRDLHWDPRDSSVAQNIFNQRRVELNYREAETLMFHDPANPDGLIVARNPVEKLYEKDASLP